MTETTDESVTPPPPESVPTTPTDDAPAPRRGRAVRVFAWIGLALTVVLAIGILLGRTWLAGYVDNVFDDVNGVVGTGSTIVAQTTGRLEERVNDLDTLITDASGIAATATVPRAIADRVSSLSDRFSQIRDGWVSIRAKIDSGLATLAQIDRALPFIDLAGGPADELAALDQRIAEIDTNLAAMRSGVTTRISDVVSGATALRGAVDRVADVGERLETRLAEVEDRIDRAQSSVDTVLWLTTVVLLLLVGYVGLLNVLLIRGYRRV
jgi:hypothetical protein